MSLEKQLLGLSMSSKEDFLAVKSYIDMKSKTYSKEFSVLMSKVGEYYARDGTAEMVVPDVLMAIISESVRSDKLIDRLGEYVSEAAGAATSSANVRAVVLMAKQQELGDKLAAALTSDIGSSSIDDLMEELRQLRSREDFSVEEEGAEVYQGVDLEELMEKEYDPENVIMVYPRAINDRLDGGARPGHHLIYYGRPEIGKSAAVISASGGFARQGFRTLYTINEDRAEDIIIRHVSNLSGLTKHQIRDNPRKAQEIAYDNGLENVIVISIAPGSPRQIAHFIEKFDPKCVIVDQLRNLNVRAENRTNQLERAATEVRTLGKEANVLMLSVTQAGDSAENKLVLDQGDVDGSNTGIPAQADLMVGIGADEEWKMENTRMISLPKNKIGGEHDNFPVRINPQLSRYTSI